MLAIHVELDEDDGVLGDGAQGTNQPGKVRQEVLLLGGVEQNLEKVSEGSREGILYARTYTRAIGNVTHDGEEKEEEGKTVARLFAIVLDDLRDTCSEPVLVIVLVEQSTKKRQTNPR